MSKEAESEAIRGIRLEASPMLPLMMVSPATGVEESASPATGSPPPFFSPQPPGRIASEKMRGRATTESRRHLPDGARRGPYSAGGGAGIAGSSGIGSVGMSNGNGVAAPSAGASPSTAAAGCTGASTFTGVTVSFMIDVLRWLER